MTHWYRTRVLLAMVVFAVFISYAGTERGEVLRMIDWRVFGSAFKDRITANDERFRPLRDLLPKQGVVGYLSPVPAGKLFADPTGIAHFYLTQYALAPLIVSNDTSRLFVIANFYVPPVEPLKRTGPLTMVWDVGQGVALYRRRSTR